MSNKKEKSTNTGETPNREVLSRAKAYAEESANTRKGYTEQANVAYAYRTGFFHGQRAGVNSNDKG